LVSADAFVTSFGGGGIVVHLALHGGGPDALTLRMTTGLRLDDDWIGHIAPVGELIRADRPVDPALVDPTFSSMS
jgi:hypothetical protein